MAKQAIKQKVEAFSPTSLYLGPYWNLPPTFRLGLLTSANLTPQKNILSGCLMGDSKFCQVNNINQHNDQPSRFPLCEHTYELGSVAYLLPSHGFFYWVKHLDLCSRHWFISEGGQLESEGKSNSLGSFECRKQDRLNFGISIDSFILGLFF